MSVFSDTPSQEGVTAPLAAIPTDEGAQARVRVHAATVRAYAAAMTGRTRCGALRIVRLVGRVNR